MGNCMNVTLQEMRSFGLFDEIEQPECIYHMTDISNLETIINDGQIRTFADYVCYFSPTLKDVLQYIECFHLDEGRKYYSFDGKLHKDEPLNHATAIILRLFPRYREPMYWYKENNSKNFSRKNVQNGSDMSDEDLVKLMEWIKLSDSCRVCHYGNLKFKDDVEIYRLHDIEKEWEKSIIRYSELF